MHARSSTFLAVAALISSTSAMAVGFGRAPNSALLGSPLNFAVPVHLESGESFSAECVAADVMIGDRRLLPGDARVFVEPGSAPDERIVRVMSSAAVDEPVLTVTFSIGCGLRVSRRFTAFADPPGTPVAPPVVAEAPRVESELAPAVASPAPVAPSRGAGPAVVPAPTAAQGKVPPPRRADGRRTARATPRPVAERPVAARPARPVKVARQAAEQPVKVAPQDSLAARPAAGRPAADPGLRALPIGVARLRLEAADPESFPPPSADAASRPMTPIFSDNPVAVELAASAAARMAALEKGIDQLRSESKASRELVQQMRSRLQEAESTSRLTPWLGAGLAVMAGLALWLGLRLRRTRADADAQWWTPSTVEADKAALEPVAPKAEAPAPVPAAKPALAEPVATLPEPVARLTETASVGLEAPQMPDLDAPMPGRTPRDVAIDELIDLEQQADFFVVLGQDDAAIDLLVGHNRSSGGTSPMPYLKLLEIYKRKGDRDSYERTRERFHHRFNAAVPEWDGDLQQGRSLTDYPAAMANIESHWSRPIDALAELEASMFRRESGEPFDLPAYRDLLFLYSLAREHMDSGADGAMPAVDLLLPLGDSGPGALDAGEWSVPAAPAAAVELPEFTLDSAHAPLDLDLATAPLPIDPSHPDEKPAGRLLDNDFELRLSDDGPPSTTTRR